jgi:hypothetical protein
MMSASGLLRATVHSIRLDQPSRVSGRLTFDDFLSCRAERAQLQSKSANAACRVIDATFIDGFVQDHRCLPKKDEALVQRRELLC